MTRLGTASDDACLQLARSLAFAGEPIEARVDGRRVRIGTEAFCRQLCRVPPPGPAHPNFDPCFVFMADEDGWLAAFER